MPRDSNGTYTLPGGNPVVTLTPITSTWANTTMSDIGTALTGSLARDGSGGMTGQLKAVAGTSGAPGYAWSVDTTSGLYRAGAGDFRYSVLAADKLKITASLFELYTGVVNNVATTPSYRLDDSSASANNRIWDMIATSEQLRIRALSDALGATSAITIDRTTTTIDDITFSGAQHIFAGPLRSDTDVTDDIGTNSFRWRRGYFSELRQDDTHVFLDASSNTLRVGGTGQAWTLVQFNEQAEFTTAQSAGPATASVYINNNVPSIGFREADGGTNAKLWDFIANAEVFAFRLANDSSGGEVNIWTASRSGASLSVLNLCPSSGTAQYGGREVGFRNAEVNSQAGTTYTLAQTDGGRLVDMGNGGATTVTVPVLAAGTLIAVVNGSTTNNCTLSQSSTTLLLGGTTTTGNRTIGIRGMATLYYGATNIVYVFGTNVS